MTAVDEEFVSTFVRKCIKSTLSQTLKQWGRLADSDIDGLFTRGANKLTIGRRLLVLCQENGLLADDYLGDLELKYMQLHSAKKQWKVYRLKDCPEQNLNLDPRRLRNKLIRKADTLWTGGDVTGNMSLYAGAVWFRLHFGKSDDAAARGGRRLGGRPRARPLRLYDPNHSAFAVTFHDSPYVILSKTTARLTRILIQCIQHVYKAKEVKDIKLSGRHVTSLADLVHGRVGEEAAASVYRDEEMKENPLCVGMAGEERLRDDLCEPEEVEGIIDELSELKRWRREQVKEKFGAKRQPLLEHVDYQFNVKFSGVGLGGPDETCQSTVVMRGPSILKGLSQMSALGLIKHPMPAHLTGITAQNRNSFTITEKRRRAR